MATRKEKSLIKQKTAIAYKIRNIRADYAGVEKEDMPSDITDEIANLLTELKAVRAALDELTGDQEPHVETE